MKSSTDKHLFAVHYENLDSGEAEETFVLTPTQHPHRHRMLLRRKGYARKKMVHMGTVPYEAERPKTRQEAEQLLKEA